MLSKISDSSTAGITANDLLFLPRRSRSLSLKAKEAAGQADVQGAQWMTKEKKQEEVRRIKELKERRRAAAAAGLKRGQVYEVVAAGATAGGSVNNGAACGRGKNGCGNGGGESGGTESGQIGDDVDSREPVEFKNGERGENVRNGEGRKENGVVGEEIIGEETGIKSSGKTRVNDKELAVHSIDKKAGINNDGETGVRKARTIALSSPDTWQRISPVEFSVLQHVPVQSAFVQRFGPNPTTDGAQIAAAVCADATCGGVDYHNKRFGANNNSARTGGVSGASEGVVAETQPLGK